MGKHKEFTPKMQEVLDYLIRYKKENDGCAPSLREIMSHTSVKSSSHIHTILRRLQEEGKIVVCDNVSRTISIVWGNVHE